MSEARDRLLQAIRDVDAEIFGPRDQGEVLTNYVIVTAHRRLGDSPDEDSDAIARITLPGQALWQTLGLLHTEIAHVDATFAAAERDDDG